MRVPDLRASIEGIQADLKRGRSVLVAGPEGSGRATLSRELGARIDRAVAVCTPPLHEADAPAALVLGAAAAVQHRASPVDDAGRPTDALRQAIRDFNDTLIIHLPGSVPALRNDDASSAHHHARLFDALRVLAGARRAVWLTDGSLAASDLGLQAMFRALPEHRVNLPADDWGTLQDAAERLVAACDHRAMPVVWRLAVGSVALGLDTGRVSALTRLPTSQAVAALCESFAAEVLRRPALRQALQRVLLFRVPLASERALEAASVPPEWRDLVRLAVGYGEPFRVNPVVRAHLAEACGRWTGVDAERAHARIADAHALDDGASDPSGLGPAQQAAWIEKLHHLSESGDVGEAAWAQQSKPLPELYWERGRALSARRKYIAAAAIYGACIDRFPSDDYAHHYLAENLARAKADPARQRAHYLRAVELNPSHLWWNSRRIGQLIQQRAWPEAKRAWNEALQRIDPDGHRLHREPWVASQFHKWVAKAWLDAGVWYEARAIVEHLPPAAVRGLPSFSSRIAAAEATARASFEAFLGGCEPTWAPAIALWRRVDAEIPGLPVPACTRGEEGPTLTWSHPAYLVEIEVLPSGDYCWAALDRLTDTSAHGEGPWSVALEQWMRRVRDA